MPSYDFHCNHCERNSILTYKSINDYAKATHVCPYCQSIDLTRVINKVAIARPSRDYSGMSPQQMVKVMESGNSNEMGELFRQIGDTVPGGMDNQFNEVTEKLLKGQKPESVEADLRAADQASSAAIPAAPATPPVSAEKPKGKKKKT